MNDFQLLKGLQKELIDTLNERAKLNGDIPHSCGKTKIRRLRLQINEVMLRIERNCESYFKFAPEKWEK